MVRQLKKPVSKTTKAPVMGLSYRPRKSLAVGDVHRYFEAKAHFGEFGLGPHSRISSGGLVCYCAQNTGAIVVKWGGCGQRKTLKCAS